MGLVVQVGGVVTAVDEVVETLLDEGGVAGLGERLQERGVGLVGTSASLWNTWPDAACVLRQGAVLSGVMPARSNSAADVMIFMVEPGALAALIAMSPSGPS